MTTTPHKHAEVIKAWADGSQVQVHTARGWVDMHSAPTWLEGNSYRVKPAEPEREPIKLKSDEQEMMKFYYAHEGDMMESAICLVKEVIQWELDAGSIVTREEFDRSFGDRAKRDLDIAVAVSDAAKTETLAYRTLSDIIAGVTP